MQYQKRQQQQGGGGEGGTRASSKPATIASEEGIQGFYKGMGVNLVRTVTSSALTILTYELIMLHLTQLEQQGGEGLG